MNDERLTAESPAAAGLGRRTVLRRGAVVGAAAWAAPAISMVTAAPAFAAASGTTPTATTSIAKAPVRSSSSGSTVSAQQSLLDFTLLITNPGTTDISGVQVEVTLTPSARITGQFQSSTSTTPAGWTISELSGGDGDGSLVVGTYQFVYVYSGVIPAGGAVPLKPTVTLAPTPSAGTLVAQTYVGQNPPSGSVSAKFT